ncbi:MAG: diguanylate cyclase [Oceanospirillaceae bacterium]|nr:diguanylate cyclase [Oceanospirillaceae bacterium]MCP5334447.1 diguanylate cyclase [Oceanospirillaceae bacterium]
MQILVVDDHALFRMALVSIVQTLYPNATVHVAGSVAEARNQLQQQAVDAASVDFNLPDGQGLLLAREILEINPQCQIAMITGNDFPGLPKAAASHGIAGVISKVSPPPEIREQLARIWEGGACQNSGQQQQSLDGAVVGFNPQVFEALHDAVILVENKGSHNLRYANTAALVLGLSHVHVPLDFLPWLKPLIPLIEHAGEGWLEGHVMLTPPGGKELAMAVHRMQVNYQGAAHIVLQLRNDSANLARISELETASNTDPLTGCLNRRGFSQKASAELQRAQRQKASLCVLCCDLDYFKKLNDNFGHDVGDIALQAFARSCKSQLRPHDLLARMGGEEFVVVLPQTSLQDARQVAERIRSSWQEEGKQLAGHNTNSTVSIGLCSAQRQDDMASLLKRGDELLYQAKQKGRNCVVL